MPLFSAFTPFGALAYSSKPSRIETTYRAFKANLDDNYNVSPGTNIESFVYARAREHARARYVLDRAYNNANPLKATETLPDLETEFQIIPAPTDGLPIRRATLAARMKLPAGAGYTAVLNSLTTLLGANLISYRVTPYSEVVNYPAMGGASPGNFVLPGTTLKNVLITDGISIGLGSPQTVSYTSFDPASPVTLLEGETLVVDPNIYGITETVKVSATTPTTFVATFVNPHDPDVFATTQSYPFWVSNKRRALIVVTPAVMLQADTIRKIHEQMMRQARGVSQWMVVASADGVHINQFTIDVALLNVIDGGNVFDAVLVSTVTPPVPPLRFQQWTIDVPRTQRKPAYRPPDVFAFKPMPPPPPTMFWGQEAPRRPAPVKPSRPQGAGGKGY